MVNTGAGVEVRIYLQLLRSQSLAAGWLHCSDCSCRSCYHILPSHIITSLFQLIFSRSTWALKKTTNNACTISGPGCCGRATLALTSTLCEARTIGCGEPSLCLCMAMPCQSSGLASRGLQVWNACPCNRCLPRAPHFVSSY